MYFQKRYIKEDQAFVGTSGLVTIDLPNKGLLSCIELRANALVGAAAGVPDVWLHDALEKIELIVDGSKVVKSLTGEQLQAISQYQKSYVDTESLYNVASETQREHFLINLGRFYHDLDFMLDLSKVNDPELRITFDFTKDEVNGWDNGQAFATATTPSYSCIPHLLRESDIIPRGYIKTSEIYRFTSAESRKENMIIPRGPLYNGLYLQSWYKNEGLERNLDYVEININNGERIPFRVGRRELAAEVIRRYGLFKFLEHISVTIGEQYPTPVESGRIWQNVIAGVDCIGTEGVLWANYFNATGVLISSGAAAEGAQSLQFLYEGRYPFSLCKIPYMDEMDERTWMDSKKLGDFWVRVEEASGAGTNATVKLLADEVVAQ